MPHRDTAQAQAGSNRTARMRRVPPGWRRHLLALAIAACCLPLQARDAAPRTPAIASAPVIAASRSSVSVASRPTPTARSAGTDTSGAVASTSDASISACVQLHTGSRLSPDSAMLNSATSGTDSPAPASTTP